VFPGGGNPSLLFTKTVQNINDVTPQKYFIRIILITAILNIFEDVL